ncbi:hypothetical protein Tsubulata_028973 [Turnera subulata]|uniref:Uncharacterized protein n=1 Tax=Turnera subulata TaxID=218843 RepID=A0A9Q0F0G4_9ROSI|nr:hypothetical protein Tsubulata_028973 [Turnera subulata]
MVFDCALLDYSALLHFAEATTREASPAQEEATTREASPSQEGRIKTRKFIPWVCESSLDGLFRVERGSSMITLGKTSWRVFWLLREYVWGLVDSGLSCSNMWEVMVVEEYLGNHTIVSLQTSCLEIEEGNLEASRRNVKMLPTMLAFLYDNRVNDFASRKGLQAFHTFVPWLHASLYVRILYEDISMGAFLMFAHPAFYDKAEFFRLCMKIYEVWQRNPEVYETLVTMSDPVTDPGSWDDLLAKSTLYSVKDSLDRARNNWKDTANPSALMKGGVGPFHRNSACHFKIKKGETTQLVVRDLRKFLPDVIAKVYHELVSKLCHDGVQSKEEDCFKAFKADLIEILSGGPFGFKFKASGKVQAHRSSGFSATGVAVNKLVVAH